MNDMILILNYSDEFAAEAAKRLRSEQVFSNIISGMTTAEQSREIAPRGIILCGETQSAMVFWMRRFFLWVFPFWLWDTRRIC